MAGEAEPALLASEEAMRITSTAAGAAGAEGAYTAEETTKPTISGNEPGRVDAPDDGPPMLSPETGPDKALIDETVRGPAAPAAAELPATEPVGAESAASEPSASEPSASEPSASEPSASAPATAEPAPAEPDSTEPGTASSSAALPEAQQATVEASPESPPDAGARPSLLPLAQPLWQDLPRVEQQVLQPFEAQWNSWPATEKRRWQALARRMPEMTPEQQARALQRIDEWAALSPEQQRLALRNYRLARQLSADERKAQWERYTKMTAEEKRKLRAGGATSNTAAGHAGARTGLAKEAAQPLAPRPALPEPSR